MLWGVRVVGEADIALSVRPLAYQSGVRREMRRVPAYALGSGAVGEAVFSLSVRPLVYQSGVPGGKKDAPAECEKKALLQISDLGGGA